MGTRTRAAASPAPMPATAGSITQPRPPEQNHGPAPDNRKRRHKTGRGAWRQVVACRARWLRHEVARASSADTAITERHILELIRTAENVASERSGPVTWFEGCQQDRAWLSLHEAEAELLELLTGEELLAHSERILRKARQVLGPDDPQVKRVASALGSGTRARDAQVLAPRVAHLARATFDIADDRYAQSRGFRNRLIRISVLALLGVVALVVAASLGKVDLNAGGAHAIPTGWQTPLLVVLFGSIGAMVSAIPPLARAQGVRNPFSLPVFQCILKLAMGPLFAFVGVLMMQTEVIGGIRPASSAMSLLVWATLFGASQQSVTRIIDQRVHGMLTSSPDPEPAPPQPKPAPEPKDTLHTRPMKPPAKQTSAGNGRAGVKAPARTAQTTSRSRKAEQVASGRR